MEPNVLPPPPPYVFGMYTAVDWALYTPPWPTMMVNVVVESQPVGAGRATTDEM
jgi:hypothetical protein